MNKKLIKVSNALLLTEFKHIFRVMKLTSLFGVLCVSSAFAINVNSQSLRVNIHANQKQAKEVIKQIEEQTDYLFVYNHDKVNLNNTVTIQANNETVAEVLNQMFAGTDIIYAMQGNNILLMQKEAVVQQSGKVVTGTIVDPSGMPVIGANVMVKGTTNGTITDMDGKFSLEVEEGATLQISYIGYANQEIKVGNQKTLSIALKEDVEALDELVVVGYGTMKKKDLTGAVGAVKGESLAARKTSQLSNALQGTVSGVMVTRNDGSPETEGMIRVRGITTIGDNNPLVIIDGIPGNINDVNANDVESISVLKDAASSAIYGSRAAAGVVLITTKRARANSISMNYSYEYGLNILMNNPENVDAVRYMEVANELKYNDNPQGGWFQTYPQNWVENWNILNAENPNKYPITDWNDLIFEKTANRQSHQLSLSGGNSFVKTNASFSYDKNDGIYYNRFYNRYMLRINNDFKINKYISAKLDFNFKRSENRQPAYSQYGIGQMMEHVRMMPAIWPAIWSDGRYGSGRDGTNPLSYLHEGGDRDEWRYVIGGRAALEITPIKDLVVSGIIAPNYNFTKVKNFQKAITYSALEDPLQMTYRPFAKTTKLSENRNDDYNITSQILANYKFSMKRNSVSLMAGYENYYAFYEYLSASRDQYELTNYPYLDLGPLSLRDNSGSAQEVAYHSVFGRITYDYLNKYLLQANVRFDASSRFHSDYRWGTFPSFSAGWVLSEEDFLKRENLSWISFLKLRASWGTLGNERILLSTGGQNYYPYQAAMSFYNVLFFHDGKPISHLTAAQQYYALQNISWEKTKSFDLGIDANFFNNRLRFSADYYKKTTDDMLLALEIPDYVGFDNPQKNTGSMYTRGFDLELGWNDKIGEFDYSVSLNVSDFVSKMGNLGGTEFLGDQVKLEGSQFNEWYGYLSDGLFLTEEELINSPKLNNSIKIGDVKYKDISGPEGMPDGKISPEYDRVLLGGSLPRYLYGGSIRLGYKNFDFLASFQGVGNQNVRYPQKLIEPISFEWGSVPKCVDGKFWSPRNTDERNAQMKFPRASTVSSPSNYTMSDLWLFNGRYFRVKNLTLGYNLPTNVTEMLMIKRARVYVSANDFITFSKFPKGWDPEVDALSYPVTASLLFGISVGF